MKKMWQIMVPTVSNEGKPFRTRYHRVWDQKVRSITGGLTINMPVQGQWVDEDGTLYAERMIPVSIIATEKEIDEIATFSLTYYNQIAIMYYMISDVAVIKRKD